MRLLPIVLSVTALSAVPLAAQNNQPAPPSSGLSGLQSTVANLEDQPAPAAEPVPAAETSPAPPETRPAPAGRPAAPVTQAEGAALTAASQRGQQLTVLARAGQLATRDMLGRISNPEAAGIVGWVGEPEGNAIEVIFYARGAGGPVAVYRGNVLGGRVVSPRVFAEAERTALNPIEARMAAARDATDGIDRQTCGTAPFNVLVIPPATPIAPIDVYQLTPPSAEGRLPTGGHYKATVAGDGRIRGSVSFADGCVDAEIPTIAADQQPEPIAIRRAGTPLPTEVDVFLSILAGRPLRISAGEPARQFIVAGDRIRPVAS